MATKDIKGCNYRMVGYQESVAPDFLDKLKEMGVPFAVSLLHDKDVYEHDEFNEDGSLKHRAGDIKKPHFHVFIKFSGGTTWKTVFERVAKPLGLVLSPIPQKCLAFSEVTALRYFLHMDDPEKYQYGIDNLSLCTFYGYDEKKLQEIFYSSSARVSYFLDLKKIINAYDIIYLNKLFDYLEVCQMWDGIEYLSMSGRNAIKDYIKDRCLEIYGNYKPSDGARHNYCVSHGITPIEEQLEKLQSELNNET